MMKTFKLHCEILSPLHIGGGVEIDPLHYTIKDEKLYKLSFRQLVEGLSPDERNTLENIIDKGNILGLRRYVIDKSDIIKNSRYEVDVLPGVQATYKDKIKDVQNQLLIIPPKSTVKKKTHRCLRPKGANLPGFRFLTVKSMNNFAKTAEKG